MKLKENGRTGDTKPVLFAFPYAGGTALSYMNWKLPEEIRFVPLDYSGHGLRGKGSFAGSIQEIAEDAAEIMHSKLEEGQIFYVFAHSMGGIVAWYAIRNLQEKYGLSPKAYFPSCSAIPNEFPPGSHKFDSDETVMEYLKNNMRLPEKTLKDPRFQKRFLPAILHDFRMMREYHCTDSGEKADFPIHGISAAEDKLIDESMVKKWKDMTKGNFSHLRMEGDHFYFEDPEKRKILLDRISSEMLD